MRTSLKPAPFRRPSTRAKTIEICFYVFIGYIFSLHYSLGQSSFVDVSSTKSGKSEGGNVENGKSESIFRPVYVYSNHNIADQEADPFRLAGTMYAYSQVKQDQIILALTKANDEKSNKVNSQKFFVDLAANDPIKWSNSIYLEKNGWDGVCIEGNPQYWYDHGRYRRCSIVGAFVGGPPEEDGQQVDIALGGIYGGIVAEGMDNDPESTGSTVKRELVSILTVFHEMNVPSVIDYFSLDVEGAESLVMANFPWDNFKFLFMTVERPKPDLKAAFEAHGYYMVKELVDWGETLWAHKDSVDLTQEEMLEIIAQLQN